MVELRYAGPEGVDGAVVGAVEIIDDHLRIVAGSVVTARKPTAVQLPAGRYLARGWLPSGLCMRTTFETIDARTTIVDLQPLQQTPVARTIWRRPTGWLRSWSHDGRTWAVVTRPQVADVEPDTLDVTTPVPPGAISIALQAGADDQATPPLIIVAPPGQAVRLSQGTEARGSQWRVGLPVDLGSTLLDYMHQSDLASADIVARHALADRDTRISSEFTELVMGYYLVQTGHERARRWVERLQWSQPDSVDVAVLNACLLRRDPEVPVQVIVDELVRAAAGGLPLLARGVHMLAAGLAAAAADDHQAESALARLRPYNTALGESPLTTFPGVEPSQPMTERAIWSTTRPANAVAVPALSTAVTTHTTAEPSGAADYDYLDQVLLRLRGLDLGALSEGSRRVVAGNVVLTVRVSRSDDSGALDLELLVDEPRGSRTQSLADVVVDLQVNSALHCLATFESGNRCTFVGVPPGSWSLTARTRTPARRRGRALPLPQPPAEMALLAAEPDELTEVMRTMLPLNRMMVVLRRVRDTDEYKVELLTSGASPNTIAGIKYGRIDDTPVFRLVPFTNRHHGGTSSTLRLDRFDVRQPWQVFPEMTTSQVDQCPATDITASVDAAGTAATVDAWRQLAAELTSGLADIVRSHLDEPNRS